MKQCLSVLVSAFILFSLPLSAQDTLPGLKPDRVSFSGYGSLVNGRLTSWKYLGNDYGPKWYTSTVLNLVANLRLSKNLTGHIGLEGYNYTNTTPIPEIHQDQPWLKETINWTFYAHQIEAVYSCPASGPVSLEFGLGLFPYKYNPDAWNLGEYLFRTGTYPGYIITNFDQAWTRLTGLRATVNAFGFWHNDFLLTREMEYPPFGDGTFTWISDVNIDKVLDLGGGISLSHWFSANESFTTPHEIDPHNNVATVDSTPVPDTTWYTFRGIKLMARFSFDPKPLVKDLIGKSVFSMLGTEDGKIYGEAAVLGLADQDTCYSNLAERIPVMVGVNVPAFGILDVLALQAEYYDSPYPNTYEDIYSSYFYGVPAPHQFDHLGFYSREDYKHDNWKWSVYANKFFFDKHFGLIGQVARDHWRTMTSNVSLRDYEEALVKPNQWYWATKVVFIF